MYIIVLGDVMLQVGWAGCYFSPGNQNCKFTEVTVSIELCVHITVVNIHCNIDLMIYRYRAVYAIGHKLQQE